MAVCSFVFHQRRKHFLPLHREHVPDKADFLQTLTLFREPLRSVALSDGPLAKLWAFPASRGYVRMVMRTLLGKQFVKHLVPIVFASSPSKSDFFQPLSLSVAKFVFVPALDDNPVGELLILSP